MERIKGLNTIRMSALLLIIIYHFFPKFLKAGFLGVDMLLVLSGFLMTRSIFTEIQKTGDFDYKNYFKKRFFRIFPTLFLMIGITLLISLFSNPDFLVDIDKQIAATIGFVTNWYEILSGGSYEAQFIDHLFLHTWYLSIEVFFYVLWAFVFIGLIKFNQKKIKSGEEKRNLKIFVHVKNQILVISFFIALIGIILMTVGIIKKQNIAYLYFSNLTRSYPLFIGSFIACLFHNKKQFVRIAASYNHANFKKILLRNTIIGFVIILILTFTLSYEKPFTYYLGILMTSILTCILIYYALLEHAAEKIHMLESSEQKFNAHFNKISYSLYLFHWPLFVLAKQSLPIFASVLIAIIASYFLALFATYIWEPAWQGKLNIHWLKTMNQKKYLLSSSIGVFLIIVIVTLSKAPWLSSMQEALLRNSLMQSKDAANNIIVKAEEQEHDAEERAFQESIKGATIYGDSVMVGPRDYLQEIIPDSDVDAEGYRTLNEVYDLIQEKEDTDDLREFVVIAMGTNSSFQDNKNADAQNSEEIIAKLPAKHRLIFITPYDGRGDASWGSWQYRDYLLTLEDKYDFVTVGDWFDVAQKNPQFYEGTDLLHFYGNQDAYEAYGKLILDTIERAKERPAKPE